MSSAEMIVTTIALSLHILKDRGNGGRPEDDPGGRTTMRIHKNMHRFFTQHMIYRTPKHMINQENNGQEVAGPFCSLLFDSAAVVMGKMKDTSLGACTGFAAPASPELDVFPRKLRNRSK